MPITKNVNGSRSRAFKSSFDTSKQMPLRQARGTGMTSTVTMAISIINMTNTAVHKRDLILEMRAVQAQSLQKFGSDDLFAGNNSNRRRSVVAPVVVVKVHGKTSPSLGTSFSC
jgi:hypothetical protein